MKIFGREYNNLWKDFLFGLAIMIAGAVMGSIIVPTLWGGIREFFASEPYVAVLISKKSIDFQIPQDFMAGFETEQVKSKQPHFVDMNGTKVQIRHEEDFLSVEKTALIAKRLSLDKNCILVIGNSNSTLTNVNLDIFLSSEDKMPFLMPIATDNRLLEKAEAARYNGVLRMLPDNSKQADTIEALVKRFAANRRVAIYGDEENQSYSINLSRDIADRIRRKGGVIVIEELIGPTNSFYNSSVKWTSGERRPQIIIYAGVSHHGLLLLDQISQLDISVPIIFSDGCLVPSLLVNTSQKLSRKGRAFVLSPAEFKEGDIRLLPSYKPIGIDAYNLASTIINRSPGTREGVFNYISKHRKEISFAGEAGKYSFNLYGDLEDRKYIVYEMIGGRLVPFTDY